MKEGDVIKISKVLLWRQLDSQAPPELLSADVVDEINYSNKVKRHVIVRYTNLKIQNELEISAVYLNWDCNTLIPYETYLTNEMTETIVEYDEDDSEGYMYEYLWEDQIRENGATRFRVLTINGVKVEGKYLFREFHSGPTGEIGKCEKEIEFIDPKWGKDEIRKRRGYNLYIYNP